MRGIFLDILKQRTTDVHLKQYTLTLLQETHSLAYTRNYLIQLESEILKQIDGLNKNSDLEKIITILKADYMNEPCLQLPK
jgi:geranylgeranyl diphosphate synthase type 3